MLFKKKQKVYCKHEWQLLDYHNVIGDFDIDDYYEIGCPKCETTRTIDDYTYSRMLDQQLLSK
jgi:hypothetical protein